MAASDFEAVDACAAPGLRSVIDNYEVKLRCVLDLAVSSFALDHPLRVYIPVSSQAVAMSAGGSSWDRFLVWKVFRQKADQKIDGESVMEPEH